jgi:carbon monoxide dehydrogenase subunit G
MDLAHRFAVPTPVEETWGHFQDIASVAECFPGAQVTSAEGDSFSGTVKVRLGPIALVYGGSGTFVEKDETAHRFVVDAKGKDKRGNGTAGATVTLTMASAASGGTEVEVLTDLAVTGKPAQFGRGVMQDVSDKLLGQFVACLEQRLGSDAGTVRDESVVENPVPTTEASQATPEDAGAGAAATAVPAAPEPAPAPAPDADAGSATTPSAGQVTSPGAGPAAVSPRPKADDAINLGSAVLPVLLRTYWWAWLAMVVIVVVIVLVAV